MAANALNQNPNNKVHDQVSDYYGKQLQKSEDLKTNACCTIKHYPKHILEGLKNIHDEVSAKYYGCGLTIPTDLTGLRVLDLGSGSGRDCYLLSQLVGDTGEVIGVDMTDEQLAVANDYLDYHGEKFGYKNVKFLKGNIEKLFELGLEPNSFDLIVSNCVINLASNKEQVLSDAFKLLKEGGEFYFSDVYSDRRIPHHLVNDPVLYGECLSGALYYNDFIHLSKKVGFIDPRMVEEAPITIENAEIEKKCGEIEFHSITYRLMKLPNLENESEDYGHTATYLGTSDDTKEFVLDAGHVFEKNVPKRICGNSYRMIADTRLKEHFNLEGDFSIHLGQFFECKPVKSQDKGITSCC